MEFAAQDKWCGSRLDTVPDVTPQTAHAAALTVVEHALDRSDARELLATLGLGGKATRIVTRLDCGHLSTDGYRRATARGIQCRACDARKHARRSS